MRHRLHPLPTFLLLVCTAGALALRAPATVPAADDGPLSEAMDTLKGHQRGLRKLVGDPVANRTALLESLGAMEAAMLVAFGEDPPRPEGQSEADAALWRVGFKQGMARALVSLLAMQEAVLRGDAEALSTAYDELRAQEKAGHETFRDF